MLSDPEEGPKRGCDHELLLAMRELRVHSRASEWRQTVFILGDSDTWNVCEQLMRCVARRDATVAGFRW
jgi:hypothetical protein